MGSASSWFLRKSKRLATGSDPSRKDLRQSRPIRVGGMRDVKMDPFRWFLVFTQVEQTCNGVRHKSKRLAPIQDGAG